MTSKEQTTQDENNQQPGNDRPITSDVKWPDVPPVYFKSASIAIVLGGITLTVWGIKVIFLCSC